MKFFTNGTWEPRSPEIVRVKTPEGVPCLACGKPIGLGDCGVLMIYSDAQFSGEYRPWHLACFRSALGIEEVAS
jgi:hypothetical protein